MAWLLVLMAAVGSKEDTRYSMCEPGQSSSWSSDCSMQMWVYMARTLMTAFPLQTSLAMQLVCLFLQVHIYSFS